MCSQSQTERTPAPAESWQADPPQPEGRIGVQRCLHYRCVGRAPGYGCKRFKSGGRGAWFQTSASEAIGPIGRSPRTRCNTTHRKAACCRLTYAAAHRSNIKGRDRETSQDPACHLHARCPTDGRSSLATRPGGHAWSSERSKKEKVAGKVREHVERRTVRMSWSARQIPRCQRRNARGRLSFGEHMSWLPMPREQRSARSAQDARVRGPPRKKSESHISLGRMSIPGPVVMACH